MADLQRRPSRRVRERRAYQVAVTGGGASLVAVVALVLAIAGVIGAGVPIIAILVAVVCLVMFRRMVR